MLTPNYIHLPTGASPRALEVEPPFAAIVIIDAEVTPEWRDDVSDWLVAAGCLNMMAWGHDCSLWDYSVDIANLEAFDWQDIPDGRHIMTSWHEDETLEDVFHFSLTCTDIPGSFLETIVILDITEFSREDAILARYETVHDEAECNENIARAEPSGVYTYGVFELILILLAMGMMIYFWQL